MDDDGYWAAYYVNPLCSATTPTWSSKEDVPKTYEELLDPKWKGGKISIDDSAYGFLVGLMRAWGKEKGIEYFKKLAAQEPSVMRGNTNRVQIAMAGEYPLIIAYAPTIQRETSLGHPMDWVPLEPVPVQVNPMMLRPTRLTQRRQAVHQFFTFQRRAENAGWFQTGSGARGRRSRTAAIFRGYKRIIEHPDEYKNINQTVKLYQEILGVR